MREHEPIGALQISAYRKEEGPVTDQEIRGFGIKEHLDAGRPVHPIAVNTFRGFYASYCEKGKSWREWHLHDGRLLLLVTYNCDEDEKGMEDTEVENMLKTLKPVDE